MPSPPPPEIQPLIERHIKGFNTQNSELFVSVFGDTAIIIDGIAPYRWLNPNAPANWLADVEKWRKDLGVTYEHLAYEMGLERRGALRLRRHIGDPYRNDQGSNRRRSLAPSIR